VWALKQKIKYYAGIRNEALEGVSKSEIKSHKA
jgi:hypothetical protein